MNELNLALGWMLLHSLWQGCAVAALLALLFFLLRAASAETRYAAGCAALGLCALLPVLTFVRCFPAPLSAVAGRDAMGTSANRGKASQPAETLAVDALNTAGYQRQWNREKLERFFPVLISGWAAGVALLSLRLCFGLRRLRRWQREAFRAPEFWDGRLVALRARMRLRKQVRVLLSPSVESPCVIGWLRPLILLPAGLIAGFPLEHLELVLRHELAHIRRGDYLVNLLQSALEILFFYHPAVWWISKKVRQEREHCCDDAAVTAENERLNYARALAALEEWRQENNRIPSLALGARSGSLLGRIERLFRPMPIRLCSRPWMGTIVVLGITVLSGLVVIIHAQNSEKARSAKLSADSAAPPPANTSPPQPAAGPPIRLAIEAKFCELRSDGNSVAFRQLLADPRTGEEQPVKAHAVETWIDVNNRHRTNQVLSASTRPSVLILNSNQFQAAVTKIKIQRNSDLLSAPAIEVFSGMQAQVQVQQTKNIVTSLETNRPPAGVRGADQSQARYRTDNVQLGPSLEVFPLLLSDRQRVLLKLTGNFREFLGYDQPPPGLRGVHVYADGKELLPTASLPRFREWKFEATATVPLGSTVALQGMAVSTRSVFVDKVAVLGDIPLLGRLFTRRGTTQNSKELVVFVSIRSAPNEKPNP